MVPGHLQSRAGQTYRHAPYLGVSRPPWTEDLFSKRRSGSFPCSGHCESQGLARPQGRGQGCQSGRRAEGKDACGWKPFSTKVGTGRWGMGSGVTLSIAGVGVVLGEALWKSIMRRQVPSRHFLGTQGTARAHTPIMSHTGPHALPSSPIHTHPSTNSGDSQLPMYQHSPPLLTKRWAGLISGVQSPSLPLQPSLPQTQWGRGTRNQGS